MTAVWDCATDYAKGELLVLLALADWANDEGQCHPSVPRIAHKSRLTERQVYNVLKRLQCDGVITVQRGGGRGRLTVYQIHSDRFSGRKSKPKDSAENTEINSVKSDAEPGRENPEIRDTETLKSATRNPEISDNPPDPLLGRTVREPSEGTVKESSPYPLADERVKSLASERKKQPHVDGMAWGRFRYALKQQLGDAPLNHPNFSEVVKGEWDFNACFRDWWLIGCEAFGESPGVTAVVTEAANPEATKRGLHKYRKRIEALMREHFGGLVSFVVRQREAA